MGNLFLGSGYPNLKSTVGVDLFRRTESALQLPMVFFATTHKEIDCGLWTIQFISLESCPTEEFG